MLPYRSAPGIPCVRFAPRPLRSAKGTGLSEPRITQIAQMGCDAPRPFVPMVVCIGDCGCCLNRGLR